MAKESLKLRTTRQRGRVRTGAIDIDPPLTIAPASIVLRKRAVQQDLSAIDGLAHGVAVEHIADNENHARSSSRQVWRLMPTTASPRPANLAPAIRPIRPLTPVTSTRNKRGFLTERLGSPS
jgi:hypothetical protein